MLWLTAVPSDARPRTYRRGTPPVVRKLNGKDVTGRSSASPVASGYSWTCAALRVPLPGVHDHLRGEPLDERRR
jgi:hypothetical protein